MAQQTPFPFTPSPCLLSWPHVGHTPSPHWAFARDVHSVWKTPSGRPLPPPQPSAQWLLATPHMEAGLTSPEIPLYPNPEQGQGPP